MARRRLWSSIGNNLHLLNQKSAVEATLLLVVGVRACSCDVLALTRWGRRCRSRRPLRRTWWWPITLSSSNRLRCWWWIWFSKWLGQFRSGRLLRRCLVHHRRNPLRVHLHDPQSLHEESILNLVQGPVLRRERQVISCLPCSQVLLSREIHPVSSY